MSSPETISGSWRRRPGSMGAPSWFRVPRWLTRSRSGMAGRIVPSAICTMPRGCPLLPSAATIGEMQQCRHRSLRGDLRVSAQSCPQERRPASRKKLQSRDVGVASGPPCSFLRAVGSKNGGPEATPTVSWTITWRKSFHLRPKKKRAEWWDVYASIWNSGGCFR